MELRRLSYFIRIAEDGSLTRASGVLRIAQPALSRQIRMLEEELGVSLFSRTARGMQLTEEGEQLRASITGPLRELDLALQNIRTFSSRIEGDFTIGLPPNVADLLAKPLVLRMDADLPNIRLRVVEGPSGSLVDWLNRGIVDFAVLEAASRDDRLSDRALKTESLMLTGAGGTLLSPDAPMAFGKVAQLPLILPSHHFGIRSVVNAAAAKVRATLNIRFEADVARLAKELVAEGIGYAILPLSYFRAEVDAGTLRYCPIADAELPLTLFLTHRTYSRANIIVTKGLERKIADYIVEILGEAGAN